MKRLTCLALAAAISAGAVSAVSGTAAAASPQADEGATAAQACVVVVANNNRSASAHCNKTPPYTHYRLRLLCVADHDERYAQFAYGRWRLQGGQGWSRATCPSVYHIEQYQITFANR